MDIMVGGRTCGTEPVADLWRPHWRPAAENAQGKGLLPSSLPHLETEDRRPHHEVNTQEHLPRTMHNSGSGVMSMHLYPRSLTSPKVHGKCPLKSVPYHRQVVTTQTYL